MTVAKTAGAALVLMAISTAAGAQVYPPPPPPAPMPAPPPEPSPTPPPPSEDFAITQELCILQKGQLVLVEVLVSGATGKKTYNGKPFPGGLPPEPYAASMEWYAKDRPLLFDGRTYLRDGAPTYLEPRALSRVGFSGPVPVFIQVAPTSAPGAPSGVAPKPGAKTPVYVPVAPECRVQRYKR